MAISGGSYFQKGVRGWMNGGVFNVYSAMGSRCGGHTKKLMIIVAWIEREKKRRRREEGRKGEVEGSRDTSRY